MNRIDRIAAILIHLQSKKMVKAEEIAQRFQISLRTVYRDMKALEEAGVPLGAEPGKGYFIIDGYHLPPVMFTEKEAGAFVMAEKLVEKLTDKELISQYRSALFKIKSVLPNSKKDYLEALGACIEISYKPFTDDGCNIEFLSHIQEGLARKKLLEIDYYAQYRDQLTHKRVVEPYGLYFYGHSWHLLAFCREREDVRDFRVDRIRKLLIVNESFKPRYKNGLSDFFDVLGNKANLICVELCFEPEAYQTYAKQKLYYGFIEETNKDGVVHASFLTDSFDYIGRWLATFGKHAFIVSPPKFVSWMKTYVEDLHKRYC